MRRAVFSLVVFSLLAFAQGCAVLEGLKGLVQAPQFSEAEGQPSEIRLLGPGQGAGPLGGAAIRLYTRVRNPNAFGLTLSTLQGTLFLEGSRAADADFPLGLPLAARGDEIVPLDLRVSFADRLHGTVGVDAGQLGRPTFGPMTLIAGEIRPR